MWGSHLKNGWSIRPLDTVYAMVALGAVLVPRELQRPHRLYALPVYRVLRVRIPRTRNISPFEEDRRQSNKAVSSLYLFQCRLTQLLTYPPMGGYMPQEKR